MEQLTEQFKKGMEEFQQNWNNILKGDFKNLFENSTFTKFPNMENVDKRIFENQIKYQKAFIEYQKSIVAMMEAAYDNFNLINKKD